MVLTRLFPKRYDCVGDLHAATLNALAAAEELAAGFGDAPRDDHVRRLRELEHRGDGIVRAIHRGLARDFLPAIAPTVVLALARALDGFVDDIEEAGHRRALYRLDRPTEPARRLAGVVHAQAVVLADTMLRLERAGAGDGLADRLVELHRLENAADDLLHAALAGLYDGVADVPGVVAARQWGEIYGLLEHATDRAEAVAHVLEGLVGQR